MISCLPTYHHWGYVAAVLRRDGLKAAERQCKIMIVLYPGVRPKPFSERKFVKRWIILQPMIEGSMYYKY